MKSPASRSKPTKSPEINELVAYNRSGGVYIGRIVEIGRTKNPRKVNIRIQDVASPEISTIKNPKSFISLEHLIKEPL